MIEGEPNRLNENPGTSQDKCEVIAAYFPNFVRYASIRTGNQFIGEELAGDITLKAFEGLSSWKDRGIPFEAWLYRIARNTTVDYLRRQSQRPTIPLERTNWKSESVDNEFGDPIESEHIIKDLDNLPAEKRRVLQCRFINDLSPSETASMLGKSRSNVAQLQKIGLRKLRKMKQERIESINSNRARLGLPPLS